MNAAAAALLVGATPAMARLTAPNDPALVYLQARAASMAGDHGRSATLLASLAQSQPNDADLTKKALSEAVSAGQFDLALQLARQVPQTQLTSDARLLLAADELRRNRPGPAQAWLASPGDASALQFLNPLIQAWSDADRGDVTKALEGVSQIPPNGLLGPLRFEQEAFMWDPLESTCRHASLSIL